MRYLTAGESHGPSLTTIIEGIPSGLKLSVDDINKELKRRQGGYGRGGRMSIEKDCVKITSGVRHGQTTGSPITLIIENKDHQKWLDIMSVEEVADKIKNKRKVIHPRPGHADLVGGIKYRYKDLRNALERASARETAVRVAVGAIAKLLLGKLGIETFHHVSVFGGIKVDISSKLSYCDMKERAQHSQLSIVNSEQEEEIKTYIDQIKREGNTIGGVIETIVIGIPVGLGSFVQWDRKLDAKLAQSVISINAFKGVEFGSGFAMAYQKGSEVMDEILWDAEVGYTRKSNHLGGFEGGVTNGQPIIIKGVMKPIPTLYTPLDSVNIENHQSYKASVERSDPTAVPAAGVVMENVIATVLAQELLEKFSSDTMDELISAYREYLNYVRTY